MISIAALYRSIKLGSRAREVEGSRWFSSDPSWQVTWVGIDKRGTLRAGFSVAGRRDVKLSLTVSLTVDHQ